eukprot:TRINITY_DN15331_c0_g1::TRINITY_DN15331_c0_g1_i1::g.22718::m.22718 TRINITY_DN15331_c0_g1::TRINITY_DN15331_c0_g1_i1::g.22718  ORF type:complete len:758 (+),score=47.65,sp/F4JBP3/ATG1B_ARATH/46.86/2e-80,Pkinase/PF00069.20/9.6e-77,Pkinase_Tyr/PF07714.12/1.2e-47,DUF3543/PF12063.3/1.9e-09,Kdo/PF06293.9/7.9e-05,APH/PF01636.18/4.4e+02,APH/PF01636.18/0.2,MIT/PF04212.13/1.3e+03,MIT/PF04212.13/0.49,Kinase-like/PF14531.1/1.8e+03,Kinase-like/PF14531.1/0.28,ABC1/PF03109.11/0.34,DUF605/PF04652.11/11 TRINITY_DN
MTDRPATNAKIVGDYQFGEKLGKGSFARVYKGYHLKTGQPVAVKVMEHRELKGVTKENLQTEINILRKLDHPNIVRLCDLIVGKCHIYLFLEFCNLGDLSRYIKKHGPLSEDKTRELLRQLSSGLEVLHNQNVIHRDLKPQNLLLCGDEDAPTLKLADFGFARYFEPQKMMETLCGSPLYMAPEVLSHNKYDAKADLWSVGVILYEMLFRRTPYDGENPRQLLDRIRSREVSFPADCRVSAEAQHLIKILLCRDPTRRASHQDLCNHPFLRTNELSESNAPSVQSTNQPDSDYQTSTNSISAGMDPSRRQSVPPSPGGPLSVRTSPTTSPLAMPAPNENDGMVGPDALPPRETVRDSATQSKNPRPKINPFKDSHRGSVSNPYGLSPPQSTPLAAPAAPAVPPLAVMPLTGMPLSPIPLAPVPLSSSTASAPQPAPFSNSKSWEDVDKDYLFVDGSNSTGGNAPLPSGLTTDMPTPVPVPVLVASIGAGNYPNGGVSRDDVRERAGSVGKGHGADGSMVSSASPHSPLQTDSNTVAHAQRHALSHASSLPTLYRKLSQQNVKEGFSILRLLTRQGNLLSELSDLLVMKERGGDAFAVIIKALDYLQKALDFSRAMMPISQSDADVLALLSTLREYFLVTMDKADALKGVVESQCDVHATPTVIYEFALELGREAAADEVLGKLTDAVNKYERSLVYLHILAEDIPEDREIIHRYIESFHRRREMALFAATSSPMNTSLRTSRYSDSQLRPGLAFGAV